MWKSTLASYTDVFALDNNKLGTTNLTEHRIDTGDQPPTMRRMPFTHEGSASWRDVVMRSHSPLCQSIG